MSGVRDALLLVDVVGRFEHDGAGQLLGSFRDRLDGFRELLRKARGADVPVVYIQDNEGRWDSDARATLEAALAGPGGDVVRALAPEAGERFVFKPRYSAFDHTPVVIMLRGLEVERIVLAGGATERCVVQSAIDARELEFKVTIVADACATIDEQMERLALEYAERIVGARLVCAEEWDPGRG